MHRKQNFQTIAWFWDLKNRGLLDLDPPYQRRSVWNQPYRDFFIDTVLLGYPAPALFLFEQISAEGRATYHVVDGKQRLTTVFSFIENEFPVFEEGAKASLRGLYFRDLPDDTKREFWTYQFTVEYLPTDEDGTINNIFDRINRNTLRLSRQELRHAKFNGLFITECEKAAEVIEEHFGDSFPRIATQQRRQMKDIEFAATLMLLLEVGSKGFSADGLDEAFSSRDDEWPEQNAVITKFYETIDRIKEILSQDKGDLVKSGRYRNQADFYSLFGAIAQLDAKDDLSQAADRLTSFAEIVSDDEKRAADDSASQYYEAARSASNDSGPRETRIHIIKRILLGEE
jgi:hypothetical protein